MRKLMSMVLLTVASVMVKAAPLVSVVSGGWHFEVEEEVVNLEKTIRDPVAFLKKQRNNKVIIDTDGGVDDATALMMAVAAPDMDVLAITTTAGNTYLKQVVINTLKTLRVMKSTIPVYPGCNESILITPPSDNYYGLDGFGDVPYPNPPSPNEAQKEHAVTTMIHLVHKYPKQITIIALGPLTNIALAIKLDPEFKKKAKLIYWMGGSVKGVGNVKPGIEFNAYFDPAANFIALNKTGVPIVLISWELSQLTAKVPIDWRTKVLGKVNSPQVKFLNSIEGISIAKETSGLWASADPKAMAIAINSGIVTKAGLYHVEPSWEGEFTKGLTVVDYNKVSGKALNAIVVEEINVETYKKMVQLYLSSSVK